jgi:hypothetical protein
MKKLLLLLAITASLTVVKSQDISITYGSNTVTNDTVFLSVPVNSMLDEYFHINNLTGSSIDCHVVRYVECAPTAVTHNWCFGIACYGNTIYEANGTLPASSFLEFHLGPIILSANTKGYIFKYVFYPNASPADSVWFWLVNDPNGDCTLSSQMLVNAAQTKAKIYPNPANDFVNLDYKVKSNNANLDIHNIIGEKVKSVKLTAKEGVIRINTLDLPSGTYIGNIVESGIRTKTIKIIISH